MERHVKERLVGAAVLMAAAVILIPEMLSGPKRDDTLPAKAAAGPEAPLKTYTIDLSATSGAEAPASGASSDRAPPPEDAPPPEPTPSADGLVAARPVEPQPENRPPPVQATPESEVSARTAPANPQPVGAGPRETVPTPAPAQRSAPQPATSALASGSSTPRSRAWAVQVGSFSKEATAQSLVQSLRADGVDAFVMPVKAANGTLYRVRVGPMQERSAADTVASRLRPQFAGAAVVAHP